MAKKLGFKNTTTSLLIALTGLGVGAGAIKNITTADPQAKVQTQVDLDGFAQQWAACSIAEGKLDYYSKDDPAYLAAAEERGEKSHKYYGPYALSLEQLVLAGYVEEKDGRFDWTGKKAGGKAVETRADFLSLDAQAHNEVFKQMLMGVQEKFRYEERDDGLLLFALASGETEKFYQLLNEQQEGQGRSSVIDNFQLDGAPVSFEEMEAILNPGDLDRALQIAHMNELTLARMQMDAFPDFEEEIVPKTAEEIAGMDAIDISGDGIEVIIKKRMAQSLEELKEEYDQQREKLEEEMEESLPAVPEGEVTPVEEEMPLSSEQQKEEKTFTQKIEAERSVVKSAESSVVANKVADYFWHRRGEPQQGVFEDAQGTRRYTKAGLSMNDLKIAGFLVEDKKTGAMIWSERSGVHTDLGITYEEYKKNWSDYADEARQKFVQRADKDITEVMGSFVPAIWHNVVQAYGGDNYLDAEGYRVDGKEYTLDAMSITALARFHGMKATMKFLESRDRRNPVISESMKETLETFHGLEHEYELEIAPWRVFTGEGGVEYRTLDYRKQYAVQDMGKYDYILLLESKAFRESSYDLTATSGSYKGFYQIHKAFLKEELAEYNKANETSYTINDFDKKQWLQTAIIKQFHQKTAGYAKAVGLVNYTPYVMNRNLVQFEHLNPKFDIQESMILTPEKFAKAKLLEPGTGKTEFGYQVGAVYSLNGNKVRVTDVGTRSVQIDPNMLLSMAHLGGSGNIIKSMEKQMRWNQQAFEDGNKTPVFEYAFLTNHAINSRSLKDAKRNESWDVPKNKAAYAPEQVYKKLMPEFRKQQAVKGRETFDAKDYQRELKQHQKQERTAPTAAVDSEKMPQGSWVGQMSNKERRQHGIS